MGSGLSAMGSVCVCVSEQYGHQAGKYLQPVLVYFSLR